PTRPSYWSCCSKHCKSGYDIKAKCCCSRSRK
ncbi:hypothetical protein MTO96_045573, partial [Rhipicephalus appendiculatus]